MSCDDGDEKVNFPQISGRWTRRTAIGAAGALAVLGGIVLFHSRSASVPTRPLRIGFENNPPVQIRTAAGSSGLSVEHVTDATGRAGINLVWVEAGTSSDEALRKGLVDL